jgi:hypothetical protein
MTNDRRTRRLLRRAAVALLVAGLVCVAVPGCGGGDSSTNATGTREEVEGGEAATEGLEGAREGADQGIAEAKDKADQTIEEAKESGSKQEIEEAKEQAKESLEEAKEEAEELSP